MPLLEMMLSVTRRSHDCARCEYWSNGGIGRALVTRSFKLTEPRGRKAQQARLEPPSSAIAGARRLAPGITHKKQAIFFGFLSHTDACQTQGKHRRVAWMV